MGIFDLFGGKNKQQEAEQEQQQALLQEKQEQLEELKKNYEGLEWPAIPRLNPVNVKDKENIEMIETVTAERKDEIGPMIFEEEISVDTLRFLSVQEIIFLLTTLEIFNKKSPLPGYKENHRKAKNELLSRVRDSENLYVLYDMATGFPFLERGFANIYFEKEIADKAAEMFALQFRKVDVKEVRVEGENKNQAGFFDFLYYMGIENLLIDNGAYRAKIKRGEVVAAPGDWSGDEAAKSPKNPALNFAILDFLGELKWPVKYEKRQEVLKSKEDRMISLIRKANLLVPMQHEGPAEVSEDGRLKFGKDTKLKFLIMKTQEGQEFIPVYTDMIQFNRVNKGKEWNAAVFSFADIAKFAAQKNGLTINPDGQSLVVNKERLLAMLSDGTRKA